MSAESLFQEVFGTSPSVIARAPGRVNVIGEHTDYNGGFAMPIAIEQRTTVALRLTDSPVMRAASEQIDGEVKVFMVGEPRGSFISYVQGARWALTHGGHNVPGADITVSSQVPIGSGLSSSAALLVATIRAFRQACRLSLSDLEVAKLAYRAEREFVGVPVGTMDQLACSLADTHSALLLDTRSLKYERCPLPDEVELVVVDSSVRHDHATGGYRTRRAECEEAAARLGVDLLCDLHGPLDEITAQGSWKKMDHLLQRRAYHVLSENRRVFEAAAAMRNEDASGLGFCLDASHESLRDYFEVSTPQVDALVNALRGVDGCLGARMTGGGFGGAVIALARRGLGERVADEGARRYRAAFPDAKPQVLAPMTRDD